MGDVSALPEKVCKNCQKSKIITHFHPAKSNADGRKNLCIPCYREQNRRRYRENPEPYKRRSREAEIKKDQEKERARKAAAYAQNRELWAARNKQWREVNRDRKRATDKAWSERSAARKYETGRRRQLQKYGLTLEQFDEQLAKQNGVCAICQQLETGGKSLAVDHCHSTGVVRGLLCGSCNRALGLFGESIFNLRAATRYLMSFTEEICAETGRLKTRLTGEHFLPATLASAARKAE